MLHILSEQESIANQWMNEIRNVNLQTDRMRFRKNLYRLGQVLAYEISKVLPYQEINIDTPLGAKNIKVPEYQPIIAGILRAGLPLYEGLLDYYDQADSAFVASYRSHHKDGSFDIKQGYVTCPNLDNRILILSDSMLATGSSFVEALEEFSEFGTPSQIHIVSIIAARQGIENISNLYPHAHIWTVDVDEELTAKNYIVPGLGDAGDLAYGPKHQQ